MRILLAGMSNMLSNIVTGALAQAPDIVVVGQVPADQDLALRIRSTAADAVIVQASRPGTAAAYRELLHAFPALKVIALDATGGGGFLHQLRLYSTRFAEVSVDALLMALRAPSVPIRRTARP
jgi:DNA-binding NarL/FixJ family response regulator